MVRISWMAALGAGVAAAFTVSGALADEPFVDDAVLTAEGGMLDDGSLGEMNGGTLLGHPVEPDSWQNADGYPLEFPASISAAGSPVAGAAITGADLGHGPPVGNAIGGAAGVAGDVANTIF